MMPYILADLLTLEQYLLRFKQHDIGFPDQCLNCGKSGLWLHGCYSRKADRLNAAGASLNPILIQRLFCPDCKKTCSVLPECIPPNRWYLWEVQQMAFLLLLAGKSLRAIAKE